MRGISESLHQSFHTNLFDLLTIISNLYTIANELLDEIASYLGPLDTSSLLTTCHSLRFRLEPAMIRHALAPKHGLHPLLWASEHGHLHLVKFLVTRFPVDYQNTTGSTALHTAVWRCNTNPLVNNLLVVNFLLRQGADINHMDNRGLTAIHYACGTVQTLESAEATVICLLASGADIHLKAKRPLLVPLAVALLAGRLGVARILLHAGADPNSRNKDDEPLVSIAARDGTVGVLELLLDFGADINGSNSHQSNPLLLAAQYGYLAIVKILVEKGTNLDCGQ